MDAELFHTAFWPLLSALGGACIGSFLNVCIHRIPREKSIVSPGSACPSCGKAIAWYDNIPLLSWLILGGKCRHCRASISIRYPLVELLTSLLFYGLWIRYGFQPTTLVYMGFSSILVASALIDLEHYYLPDRFTIGGMVLAPALCFVLPELQSASTPAEALVRSLIGLAAGAGSLWLVRTVGTLILKQEAMGLGDVKLLGAIGALLGWQAVVFTIMASSLAGSIVGLMLILIGKKSWGTRIPFGPWIVLGALLWIFQGLEIWQGYLAMLAGR